MGDEMARFSIGTAINDAFSLMRRRPLSVFVWGLIMVAPSVAGLGLLWPMMGDMVAAMAMRAGSDGPDPAVMANMMQFQAASWLLNIVQLLLMVVIYTAVMRAMLRPRESSFFSLRLGMDELRIAVVGLAVIVGMYIAIFVLILIGMAIGFATWSAGSPTNWLVIVGLIVTAFVAICIALARVSLIAPASVLYRTFAFAEGWRLGRGQTGSLFGMGLLVMLIIILVEGIVFTIGMAIAVAAGMAGGMNWSTPHSHTMDVNPFEGMNAVLAANWPWFAAGALVLSMVYGAVMTLSVGSYASACGQLAGNGGSIPADEQSPATVA